MNDIWSTYLKMFQDNKNNQKLIDKNNKFLIINEDTDDWEDDSADQTDDQEDDTDEQSDESDSNDQNEQSVSDKEQEQQKSADLKFSADLAAEFGNTCNKFTTLAAKVVKQRTVGKETTENLTKMLDKLKSLIEAANNSI